MLCAIPTLTPEQRVTLEARLAEAELAYHALQTGISARVIVDGLSAERVEFTSANSDKLHNYILSLKSQLGLLDRLCLPALVGPAGFYF